MARVLDSRAFKETLFEAASPGNILFHPSPTKDISTAAASDRQEVDSQGNGSDDPVPFPVAIVGMAMRLPGGVNSDAEFWDFLVNKRDGLCRVPESRYSVDAFYDELRPGAVRTKHGYFLQRDISQLDASFFAMSKLEAEKLDPQQRHLLEVVWECMENGGQTGWRGTNIGLYVGSFGEDWLDLLAKDTQHFDRYRVMSAGDFALANRVSYEYDLRGPSVAVRTGCSSSMVGLHDACQALYAGDCSSALVAGVNLIMSPTMTISMSENMVLSQSGVCRTFDAAADGYGRGEAINVIYIKPLKDALENRDSIRAIIRSTAVNCDGKTPSITTPGSEAQERLVRRAYGRAGIPDEEIGKTAFFECHGTGTVAGDTAEASVVANIFGQDGIYIGAVKPNVGHSEGASGITSVIKCVLALENRTIPPNVHFKDPNPRIPFEAAKLQVPVEPQPWPLHKRERISVNSFGIGGTNAHLILDSAPLLRHNDVPARSKTSSARNRHLLVVSANSKESLDGQIQGVTDYLETNPLSVHSLSYSLSQRREHLTHRAFSIVGFDGHLAPFQRARTISASVIFVFTGQGSQWSSMGSELIKQLSSFQSDIQAMDQALQRLDNPPTWTIEEELSKSNITSRVGEPEFAQPLTTAIQIALVNILHGWGIVPESVVGHSSGEIAAAYASGALPASVAIIIAYFRGQVAKKLAASRSGAMAVVGLGPEQVRPYLREGIMIACENSPVSVTISGDKGVLDATLERIQDEHPDTFHRRLAVNVAYHSHHMKDVSEEYENAIRPLMSHDEYMVPFYSSVIAARISEPRDLDTVYWAQNLQCQVLFSTAVQKALDADKTPKLLLEVGPHSALHSPIRQIMNSSKNKGKRWAYVATLQRNSAQWHTLLETAGQLYSHGVSIQLSNLIATGRVLTDLPSYSWKHDESFWAETRMVHGWKFRKYPHHELLGSRGLESSDVEPSWRCLLHLDYVPWLADHRIGRDIVFPCAAYVAMAGEAIRQMTGVEDYSIRNLFMRTAMILDSSSTTELSTNLRPAKLADNIDSVWYEFTISACQNGTWRKHCMGQVKPGPDRPYETKSIQQYSRSVDMEKWYNALDKRGMSYGPQFRRLRGISAHPLAFEAAATVQDEDSFYSSRYALHPILIDQALQLLSVAATNGMPRRMTRLCIPIGLESLHVNFGRGSMALAVSCDGAGGTMSGDATINYRSGTALRLQNGHFFSTQDPDVGRTNLPLLSSLRYRPHIDFMPPREQIPGTQTRLTFGKTMVRMFSLFTCDTYHQTKFLNPVEPHLKKYQSWLRSQHDLICTNHANLVPEVWESWTLNESSRRKAMDEYSKLSPEATEYPMYILGKRVHESIHGIFAGEIQPIELLMKDGGLKDLYSISSQISSWHEFFEMLGHSKPALRILEIGGGTGGDTSTALKGLVPVSGNRLYSKYTFTDISPGFLAEAKDRFKSYPDMNFATLDITRDPIEQGFEAESYDLVISSNVLHATPRLSESLANVRKLLTRGGRLFLIELAGDVFKVDYIMGLLPGWWLGEADGRADRPYVSTQRWHSELVKAGFTGVECCRYDNEAPYQLSAHMVSRILPPKLEKGEVSLLCRYSTTDWARELGHQLELAGYEVSYSTLDQPPPPGSHIISLMDLEGPFFFDLTKEDFEQFRGWLSSCTTSRLFWVTHSIQLGCRDPRYGLILGVARTLRHEVTQHFVTLELDNADSRALQPIIRAYETFLSQIEDPDASPEYEFVVQNGVIQAGRYEWKSLEQPLERLEGIAGTRMLDIGTYAMLSSFMWTLVDLVPAKVEEGHVEVDVKYVGLNFRDVMIAMGFMSHTGEIGIEGSGVIRRVGPGVTSLRVGDKVMIAGTGLMCTRKILPADRCLPIPPELPLEEAATVICVYVTVMYSLLTVGNLRKGQSVLIHSACGGVGLAAIQICRAVGAEIFATVGSLEKIQHLQKLGIPANHIFDSRSASFLPGVMKMTTNRGVDIVLNSLSGELLHASWKCVAQFGKMLELGKRDFLGHGKLDMDLFAGNRAFVGVDVLQLINDNTEDLRNLTNQMLAYFNEGKAQPIKPITVYEAEDVEKAFRYMQSGQHMGKIVIKMPEEPSTLAVTRAHETTPYFSTEASYLVVGGFGGLGRAVVNWMVEKGARSLVILCRSGSSTARAESVIRDLQEQGCSVTTVAGDVANIEDVRRAENASPTPIAGIIHLAMVLRDQGFRNMSHDEWTQALTPKVQGTWNLHLVFENRPLDFFVLLGSVAGISGWPGQTNYAGANSFLDAFAEYRRSKGLVASVIDLGLVLGIGYVSEMSHPGTTEIARSGALQLLEEHHLLQALGIAIFSQRYHLPSQLIVGLGTTRHTATDEMAWSWMREVRFSAWNNMLSNVADGPSESRTDELREQMDAIKNNPAILDDPKTEKRLTLELGKLIASYTSRPDDLSGQDLADIAIDSLMTFEIRTWFRRNAAIEITLVEVSSAGRVGGLSKIALQKLRERYGHPAGPNTQADTLPPAQDENLDFQEDLALGRAMRPISREFVDWTLESEGRVFFTGATGFLGSSLLARLLCLPQVKAVACLVRAESLEAGMGRIREAFAMYGTPMEFESKITVVLGEVSAKGLGIEEKRYKELAQWASVIYHFAGYSNYTLPYAVHRNTNVLGILEILRFANSERLKSIQYCSSMSACGLAKDAETEIAEDVRPTLEAHTMRETLGYTQSKFVAESIFWDAKDNGFPVTIYRPAIVTGHSMTGACRKDDMVNRLMTNCIRLGCYPRPPPQRWQVVPVDFVTAVISHISVNNSNIGHAFNVLQPDQEKVITLAEVFQILSQHAPAPLRSLSNTEWVGEFTKFSDASWNVTTPLVVGQLSQHMLSWAAFEHMSRYDTSNLRRALSDNPKLLSLKPMKELLKVYFDCWAVGSDS